MPRYRRDDSWREAALCQQTDPELFFTDNIKAVSAALKLCSGCPSKVPCLNFALEVESIPGVWGGSTEKQRTKMLRGPGAVDAAA